MRYLPEPPFQHGQTARTGVILINLGTPDAATPTAVRRYLKQFLSDPRVVEIPRPVWWMILRLFILPFRSKQSAHKYATVWTNEGSPLMFHTQRQASLLRGYLGERKIDVEVDFAMRYGSPSIPEVMQKLREKGCDKFVILPAYPQYSATTTASISDALGDWMKTVRNQPAIRFIRNYHDDPRYIAALEAKVRLYWKQYGRPDALLMSFHGVPRRTLTLGDPYHCECLKTGRLLAEKLELQPGQYRITFQSRFGKARWLEPYTAPTLTELGKNGTPRVDVFCPGFISDCLETLEEIAMEGKQLFLGAGGQQFHAIPCLNETPEWIHALCGIVQDNLTGWPHEKRGETEQISCAAEGARQRERALSAGALD